MWKRQPSGTTGRQSTMTATMARSAMRKATRKRLRIRGTSMKKFERSTSFLVAPHWML
jgi:hypothetical protein